MDKNKKKFKIAMTGGGTGGSVTPLLAVYDEIINEKGVLSDTEFIWLGTKNGVEKNMVLDEGIRYVSIFSGKFRRYFSWDNFFDLFRIIIGFFQSFIILFREKPNLIMSAGGFVCVPVIWSAWILRIPCMIHQQDIRPGLANKLMSPFAKYITVTFETSLSDYGKKAVLVGNPVRAKIKKNKIEKVNAKRFFNIKSIKPVVFIVGGGTGSLEINNLVYDSLDFLLPYCEIIHIYGKRGKLISKREAYHAFDFLNIVEMTNAFAASEIVVSRCGLGFLTELSYLAKPAILIPMPNSHQEDNAKIFLDKNAAIVLDETELTAKKFSQEILKLLGEEKLKNALSLNMNKVIQKNASEEIIKLIKKFT